MNVLLILLVSLLSLAENAKLVRKYYPLKWANCPINASMQVDVFVPKVFTKFMNMSAVLHIRENIPGNLTFTAETNKCSLDMKNCEKYLDVGVMELDLIKIFSFKDVCRLIEDKNMFYSAALTNIAPPLICPFKAGDHILKPSVLDLSIGEMFRAEGFIWVANFRLIAITTKVQLSITSWENCPGNQSMKMYASTNDTYGDQTKIYIPTTIDVSRDVKDLSELTLEVNRCDFEMKKCEKPFPLRFTDLCKSFNNKKAFYYGFISTIKPPISCPIKADKYTATNGSFDLSASYFLPIRDNVWITKTKLYCNEGKKRELVLCLMSTIKVTQTRARRVGSRQKKINQK
ncbi:CLUMA_CG003013, isoform A [Clunio marinus]|uniref:CLUMA_CG003013, isoform A n=1 Tax=Clunio marinus TaxID=568069 RepID=A0A1J1HRZ8_9DIPT|nr:CLUMA_CG003013, isoform A [Clunio marinus]